MEEIARIPYSGGQSKLFICELDEVFPQHADLTVFDGNTAPLFPHRDPERSLSLPPGEAAKIWASVERILNRALALSLGRDGLIAGVGGGVVTDVTAFAASLYMRGCRLCLVPTTLLSMVDAATGGKTGIDFGGSKNLVGTFYPAEEVRICPELLASLPAAEYQSGLAEVIKHTLLDPSVLWDLVVGERQAILDRDVQVLKTMIPLAIQTKVEVVTEDLRENGRRAVLNLGHTFGHALEAATGFSRWTHGEAVAWGMLKALDLGQRIGMTDAHWAQEARDLILSYGFELVTPQVSPDEIKAAMSDDKKKKSGKIRFILMEGPGKPILTEVPESDLDAVLGITD